MPITRRGQRNYLSVHTGNGNYKRVDYKKIEPKKNIFQLIVEFLNSLPDDHVFTRKEIHYAVYIKDTADGLLGRRSVTSVDNYRALLCKTPFIEPTKKPGRYRKKQQIPDHVTLTKLKKFASCKDYKKWFIPFEEWIK